MYIIAVKESTSRLHDLFSFSTSIIKIGQEGATSPPSYSRNRVKLSQLHIYCTSALSLPFVKVVYPVPDEPHEDVVAQGPLVRLINQLGQLSKGCALKGESQGHNAIFKGLKMTFRTKVLEKI